MARQILTFVVLPNGVAEKGRLGVSVFLTPRLEHGATLADFPDFLHWTSLLRRDGMEFEFACEARTLSVPIHRAVLRPDIWRAVFKPNTRVAPYRIPDYDRNLFVSYPAREAMSFVKYAYQAVSVQGVLGSKGEGSLLRVLLRDLVFREGSRSTRDAALSELRVEMWREQNDFANAGTFSDRPRTASRFTQSLPPDGVPTMGSAPPQTRQMASRFALFHLMPPAPHRPPLPETDADFAKIMDFHQALTALSSYPAVLRALGLVFDLQLPEEFCPYSPSVPGGAYLPIAVRAVRPGFKWSARSRTFLPQTDYYRNGHSFAAAPATLSGDLRTGNYLSGDIIDGVVALLPNLFHLTEVDLDGALLKALGLADNVANARSSLQIEQVLPSLRSSGIALMANGRAMQVLNAIRENKSFDQALHSNSAPPRPFNALDLVRGYRIDIWSSLTGRWHSLHERRASYRFGEAQDILLNTQQEEGFTQLAAAQPAEDPTRKSDAVATAAGIPQPGTDVYIHERVAAWSGWSLSVQRPGGALNRSADPAVALDPDPTLNDPKTPFKMLAQFEPAPRTLPELRFGGRYRLRARAVDLAGNSVPAGHKSEVDLALPPQTTIPLLRFEPVPHPVLLLREPSRLGASLERWVIRSYNTAEALDSVRTTEIEQRHVSPPKIAVRLAEQHGMFDDALGKLRGDAATFHEIVTRDKAEFTAQGGVPMDPRAQLRLPFFPDPFARGAAFQNLPNTNDDTEGELVAGALRYTTLPDVQLQPGSTTHISFGDSWPEREPFRVVVKEGAYLPNWDNTARVLTIYLQKAQVAEVPLSCYMSESDLSLMGIWNWMRELLEAQETAAMQNASASELVPWDTDAFALLTRLVLAGGHPMLTPAKTIVLVHAVQQPLGRPQFTLLPVIHRPADPLPAASLHNAFAPLTAWRSAQSHHAYLLGGLSISGKSSAKVDIEARWHEFTDDLAEPKPAQKPASSHVDTIELATLDPGPVAADPLSGRLVAVYIPEVDVLWFAAPFDTLEGVYTPGVVSAPMHRFSDTKHRQVFYTAKASSRFSEYFTGSNLDFTRTGDPVVVDVPSSSRPAAPQIAYIVPTFGIERQDTTNVKTEIRFGNGVRVYVRRPWYSSGEGELLGAVLWPASSAAPSTPAREKYKHLITQWGLDPIWQTGEIPEMPGIYSFPGATSKGTDLTLEESSIAVDVAGHTVGFDATRKLWYCDITFENPLAYCPFVRLALARYQPHSIPGVELSHVVLADYAQLSPDRSVVLSVDPADPAQARVFIGGLAPQGPNRSQFAVAVERRFGNLKSDLAWEAAPSAQVTVTPDVPAPDQPDAVLWSGAIVFAKAPPPDRYRVVVREYEVLPVDPTLEEIVAGKPALGSRIVYAAIIAWNFPANGPK